MVDYANEEEQVEAIRRWWRENGRSVILGVLIGVAAIGAWRGWDWYRTEQGLQASALYESVMSEIGGGDRERLLQHARTLREDYGATPYAPLAALAAARAAVDAGEPGEAREWLRWAMENADNTEIAHVARARLARVLGENDRVGDALDLLQADVADNFTALYAEIRGDLLARRGDLEAAAAAYQEALDADVAPSDPQLLRRKLNQVKSGRRMPDQTGDEAARS